MRKRLPLHVQGFLARLAQGAFDQAASIMANLRELASKSTAITRARRLVSLALAPGLVAASALAVVVAGLPQKPFDRAVSLYHDAVVREAMENNPQLGETEAIRTYLVHHFADCITNETFWTDPAVSLEFQKRVRRELKAAVTVYARLSPDDIAAADRTVLAKLHRAELERHAKLLSICTDSAEPLLFLALIELFGVLISAQSLLLSSFGMAVVGRDGVVATRLRLLGRWAAGWGSVGVLILVVLGSVATLVTPVIIGREPDGEPQTVLLFDPPTLVVWAILAAVGLALAGAMVYAVRHPERGLQDRLAGTSLVLR